MYVYLNITHNVWPSNSTPGHKIKTYITNGLTYQCSEIQTANSPDVYCVYSGVLRDSIKGTTDTVNSVLTKRLTQKNTYCIIPFTLILSQQN